MSNNKYTRHQAVISRQSDSEFIDDSWKYRYDSALAKEAVQPRKDDIFEQLNTIMNGARSKHSTVAAAVEEMKQRSGLTDYLSQMSKQAEIDDSAKIAQAQDNSTPIVITQEPQILITLQNIIKDANGNSSIPAILSRLQEIHSGDVSNKSDWDDEKLIRLISKMNLQEKARSPQQSAKNVQTLGLRDRGNDMEIDPGNTDAFHGLMPVKQ